MTKSTSLDKSPWWYRRRALVIVFIYAAGFFVGDFVTGIVTRPLPSFALIARALHVGVAAPLWAATGLSIAGFLLRFWGSSYLSAEVVWNPDALQSRLLIAGPFRFVRNPLYLGNIFLALAIGSLAAPLGWAIVAAGNIWFSWLLGSHEADAMRERYGDVYDRYRKAVPALLPRLWPARIEGTTAGKPLLAAGLRAEVFMLSFALAMIAFTLTFDIRLFWGVALVGWLTQYVLRRHTTSAT